MTEQQMKSISVDDLFSSGRISRKTYNTLVRARMRNVFDLKRYESGLTRLFRGGTSGMREINTLLTELTASDNIPEMSSLFFAMEEPEMSKGEQLLASLSDDDLALLGIVYRKEIARLLQSHERTATKIANALSLVPVSHFIRDFLLEEDERILMLNEVGETSMPQVASVKTAINEEVALIKKGDVPVAFRILCYQAEGLLDDDGFALSYFLEHQHLPVLYVIQKALIANMHDQVFLAFLQRYDVFGGQVEIDRTKIDKSAFTITTYSNLVFDALFTPGASMEVLGKFISELVTDDANVAYLAEKVRGCLVTEDSACVAEIIGEEHLMLHPLCVTVMLGRLLAHSQTVFGGYPRSFGIAMDERWIHAYVVDRELAKAFDFQKELWRFRNSVVRMSTDNYSVNMEDYVASIIGDEYPDLADRQDDVTALMKVMVVGELGLETDEEGLVVIPRKRDKPLADRLFAILSKRKEPMMLDELTELINSGDGRRYVRASVSLALNKDERFQGSGKKGCYALSDWKLPYFGSNADIVYKVLDEANRPMRSEEIVDILAAYSYNSQFSKNDLSSVISLGKKLFRKLGLGYYGLVGRDYPSEDIQPTKRAFDAEVDALTEFLDKHHRVPSMKGNGDEVRLRTWFLRKRKEWEGSNNWSESKRQVFSLLMAKYDAMVAALQPQPMEEALHADSEMPVSPEKTDSQSITASLEILAATASSEIPSVPASSDVPSSSEDVPDSAENVPASFTEDVPASSFEDIPVPSEAQVPAEVLVSDEEWDVMASEVCSFVEKNEREPLSMFTAEVMLADWLADQKRRMREGLLSEEQTAMLLAIRDRLW